MTPSPQPAPLPPVFWLVRLAAVGYAALGLGFMLLASPKVPYADSYRFLTTFLSLPFPQDALAADNGHREVLPNLVRIAELNWFDADQWLQTSVGFALAIAATLTILGAFRAATGAARTAIAALVCTGVFWLGNGRKLAHGSEALHEFLVVLALAIGLRALSHADRRGAIVAALMGLVATLSFGSGPACFAAFLIVLFVQRAPWSRYLPLAIAIGLAAAILFLSRDGRPGSAGLAPLEQTIQLLHWLGAPFVWALSPLLDAAHAARLPEPLATLAGLVAGPAEAAFGPALAARWPATAFGAFGLVWLLSATLRGWLSGRDTTPHERFGLGMAWFGCAVGILVVIARLTYFQNHPEQVSTQRYLPWSMLFWTGLAILHVLHQRRSARGIASTALLFALLFLPSQIWTGRYALRQQQTAELTAVGAAVGVIGRDFALVETMERDLRNAVPLLRSHGKAMFAWPEARVLDATSGEPRTPDWMPTPIADVEVAPVDNLFPFIGSRVRFHATASARRLLLLDGNGIPRGLAIHTGPGDLWQGWMRQHVAAAAVGAAALP